MMLVTVRPTRKAQRRPRTFSRQTFSGVVNVQGDRIVITPAPGAYRRTTDAEGNVLADVFEPRALLPSNIEDRLLVCGPEVDEIALVTVLAISRDAVSLYTRIVRGAIAATTTKAHLLPIKTRRVKQLGLFKSRRSA